jgi:hypothetical protein
VCLEGAGKSLFYDLPFGRASRASSPSNLLHCDGQDLTYSTCRTQAASSRHPAKDSQSVLFCDHIEAAVEEFFALAARTIWRVSSQSTRSDPAGLGLGAVVQDPQPKY